MSETSRTGRAFERATVLEVAAQSVPVASIGDVLAAKLLALTEQEPDFGPVLEIARSLREQIDWGVVRSQVEHSAFGAAFFTLVDRLGVVPEPVGTARYAGRRSRIPHVRELRPGLWHWQARHPWWQEGEPWGPDVSSYAIDEGERLLLFDPLAVPSEILELAIRRETAIVLTAPWHERDSQSLVERLGVPVYTPRPDTAEYLMRTYGLTADQAGDGSPDVVWLLKEGIGEAHVYEAGDHLDVGVETFPGQKPNDMVIWVASHRSVIAGDTLVDFGQGFGINPRWLRPEMTREHVVEELRPLLELPVEHVLATHGGPTDRAALERALA